MIIKVKNKIERLIKSMRDTGSVVKDLNDWGSTRIVSRKWLVFEVIMVSIIWLGAAVVGFFNGRSYGLDRGYEQGVRDCTEGYSIVHEMPDGEMVVVKTKKGSSK